MTLEGLSRFVAKQKRLDAQALFQRLDRYVRGNRKAFSIVRVPTEAEERGRAFSRQQQQQQQQLMRERQRLQTMGRSPLSSHGIHVTGHWWKGAPWKQIRDVSGFSPEWHSVNAVFDDVRDSGFRGRWHVVR